jgi:hypothetical protein
MLFAPDTTPLEVRFCNKELYGSLLFIVIFVGESLGLIPCTRTALFQEEASLDDTGYDSIEKTSVYALLTPPMVREFTVFLWMDS